MVSDPAAATPSESSPEQDHSRPRDVAGLGASTATPTERSSARRSTSVFLKRIKALHEVNNELIRSRCDTVEELARLGVQLGRDRLGFDRVGIWFTSESDNNLHGSFGTDEQGRIRDERGFRVPLTGNRAEVFNDHRPHAAIRDPEGPLNNHMIQRVGQGSLAWAPIWDGERNIGFLGTDNLLNRVPITDEDCELLTLFASAFGHVCVRVRNEAALRKIQQELEERVRERTARLEAFNQSLQEEIAERKRIESALRESEQRFRELAENTRDAFWVRDVRSNQVLYISPALQPLIGQSIEDIAALPYPDCFLICIHEEDRGRMAQAMERLEQGESIEEEVRVVHPDGKILWIAARGFPVHDDRGVLRRIIGMGFDITHRKLAEEQVWQKQQALAHASRVNTIGEMTSSIAHELNQPLAAIANYAEAGLMRVQAGSADPARITEDFEFIARQAQRAGVIIRRTRDFLRRQTLPRELLDLNALVREVVAFQSNDAKHRGVRVLCQFQKPLPAVLVDPIQIEQVILNLLRNSFEVLAGVPQSRRTVTLRTALADQDQVELAVIDSGPGLPVDLRQRLFEPFTTTKPQGLGLGLSISASIIKAHDGRLIYRDNPRGGAVFSFTLPIHRGEITDAPETHCVRGG